MKLKRLAEGIALVPAPPLARALTVRQSCVHTQRTFLTRHASQDYFAVLQLETAGDNAARFDYPALRCIFTRAYEGVAGVPYTHCLDLAGGAGAAGSAPARKRSSGNAAAAPAAMAEAAAKPAEAPVPKRARAARAPAAPAPEPRTTRSRAAQLG